MAANETVEVRERELKFDVPPEFTLPELDALVPDGGRIDTETVQLTTTYLDTASRDLLTAGVTLRRRTGDRDAGWQLKVPDGEARVEVRAELDGRGVPEPLRDLVVGVRGGEPLRTLATLITTRTIHSVVAADATTLAEVVDDRVGATVYSPRRRSTSWRELEVELGAGDEELLGAAARKLTDAGAARSRWSSKLARAVQFGPLEHADTSLGGLIRHYVREQVGALLRADIDLRRGRPVVHGTRVAIRRLRSAVRVFADVFDPDRAHRLDAELSWYAALLGEVRDREVLLVRLADALDALPEVAVVGPVRERIVTVLESERDDAEAAVRSAMVSPRYLALVRELKAWYDEPAFAGGQEPQAPVGRYVRAAADRVHVQMRKAAEHPDTDEALHRARKAAKRARYAAELAEPRIGEKARKIERAAKAVQERLGGMHDSVIASQFLMRAAHDADAHAGESALTFGILWEREQERGRSSAAAARAGLSGKRRR